MREIENDVVSAFAAYVSLLIGMDYLCERKSLINSFVHGPPISLPQEVTGLIRDFLHFWKTLLTRDSMTSLSSNTLFPI
jgi:hypothetical protein